MSGIRTHPRTGLAAWWLKAVQRKLQRAWLDLPLRGKGLVVVSLPVVALLAGLSLLSAIATWEQDAQQSLDHTVEVERNLDAILRDLLSAESAARGYVITGHSDLLPAIESARAEAEAQIKKLGQLFQDNPTQHERIISLRKLTEEKFASIASLVQAAGAAGAHMPNPELESSQQTMQSLRAMLDRLEKEEAALEKVREQRLQTARSHSVTGGIATLALGFFGGIAAILIFSGSLARRMQVLCMNARALRFESPLLALSPARDEIGEVEKELEATSTVMARRSEKLRRSEAQLRAIIDHTTALVYIKDLDGRYTLVNRQMEEAFGIPARHFLGKSCRQIYRAEYAAEIEARDHEVLRSGEPRVFEEEVLHSGVIRTYLSHIVPLLDREGKPYALCGVASDITQRSQAAAQLHQQLEQTGQRLEQESTQHQQTAEALKSTQAQLLQAQKMEIIGHLASGVAHDFNNILTAIMGYATLLWSEAEGTTQDYAAEILQAAERAATLSKQLLGFGRVQPNEPKIIALEPVIRDVEGMLRRVIGDTISLRTAIERNVGTVRADPSQIEQLLLNLVVNARDAMPTGGRITIALRQRSGQGNSPNDGENCGDSVELSVTDEGTGIPPEVQRRMFEPFFTTKRPGQGTGLGLATCEMIAQQNNGRIEFTTAPAKGTTFILRLPSSGAPVPARPASGNQTSAPGQGTLLVVEDEPAVGEIVALFLRDLGYEVLTAENGEAAERVIAGCENEIDLIVTDLSMPRMNGRELLARLSRNNPRVRVILTSGNEELLDDATTESLEIDFLPKPFTRQGLVEKVRAVLAK